MSTPTRMSRPASASPGSIALPRAGGPGRLLERWIAWADALRAWAPPELSARWGWTGLGLVVAAVVAVVAFSTAGNSVLVPKSGVAFPGWESGPAGWLFGHPSLPVGTLTIAYSGVLLLMVVAYALALLAARNMSLRVIAATAVAINLVLLLSPPLQLTDLFNYLGYARLGALHGLNPYTHVINAETFDPVYRFSSWHNLPSPYGPLFTALTYPLAFMSLPLAYWMVKVVTVAASLGFLWCVYKCARLLDLDPRPALVLIVANPIYVFFAVGSFHNDFLMLLPTTGAIALLLTRRDRAAGAVLMLAVAIKFSAVLLLPFLLMAARPPERRLRVLSGVLLASVPLAALSIALFGFSMPNLSEQSSVVTGYSIPNLLGLLVGLGGRTPGLMRVVDLALVVIVLWQLRRRDWLAGAGWATVALIAGTSWLMPWYIVWALPLAALAANRRLRRATLLLTLFLLFTFTPEVSTLLSSWGINPMSTQVGRAASAYQTKLQR
ncbi:MAG TPA: glycosyltransferase family 87 protein [Solirubrobacteraceae bacterium]|nr:glycosyltransferase family 87 protein [Solirubrobacteraceae bacterium]